LTSFFFLQKLQVAVMVENGARKGDIEVPGPAPPPPAARRMAMLSWTTFSVGVNFALVAMMLAHPSGSPSDHWFSKARLLPREYLKQTNRTTAQCTNSLASDCLALPVPTSLPLQASISTSAQETATTSSQTTPKLLALAIAMHASPEHIVNNSTLTAI
jgi:hypothetical protein